MMREKYYTDMALAILSFVTLPVKSKAATSSMRTSDVHFVEIPFRFSHLFISQRKPVGSFRRRLPTSILLNAWGWLLGLLVGFQ